MWVAEAGYYAMRETAQVTSPHICTTNMQEVSHDVSYGLLLRDPPDVEVMVGSNHQNATFSSG